MMLFRRLLAGIVLSLTAIQAQAAWECPVRLQDDVIITSQSVRVVGASGDLVISPAGKIVLNGEQRTVSDQWRKKAIEYQAALRHDLPWFLQQTIEHLDKGHTALDKVIVAQLGEESRARKRLSELKKILQLQAQKIIEQDDSRLTFHHLAIKEVKKEGERVVGNALGGLVQDSLNEVGTKKSEPGDNPLRAIMNNFGVLQQAVKQEWGRQEQDFKLFGQQVCQRVSSLESQHRDLMTALQKNQHSG